MRELMAIAVIFLIVEEFSSGDCPETRGSSFLLLMFRLPEW